MGIGEFPDLKILVDWCRRAGLSMIQLLPLNDTGFNFRPYDAQSNFALDPMYLSLEHLKSIKFTEFIKEIEKIRERFLPMGSRVDYGIKAAK